MLSQHMHRDGAVTLAESPIGFLEQDDVGTDFGKDFEDAFGAAAAIGRDRLANIIARYKHHDETNRVPSQLFPQRCVTPCCNCDKGATGNRFLAVEKWNVATRQGGV
jgi:hypothetical protein